VENPEAIVGSDPDPGFTLAFDDYGIRDGAWTSGGVTYVWRLRHDALGRHWEGESAAAEGSRQLLKIRQPTGDSGGTAERVLSEEEALATLEVTVNGPDDVRGRSARVYLRWEPRSGNYSIVGLEH
jgi:hypothetical protein